jgi:hypothetical protein
LGKTLETDRENPLHRNKSSKLTVKIWDFWGNDCRLQNPGDAPVWSGKADSLTTNCMRRSYLTCHIKTGLMSHFWDNFSTDYLDQSSRQSPMKFFT